MTAADPGRAPRFPGVPKLALDEVLDDLVDSARGVQRAQGRIRALLRAVDTFAGELSVDTVLHNLVTAARDLAGARYAALGVVAFDGGLEQFVAVGVDDDLAARLGRLPQGKGLLGALVTDPRPIRIADVARDERSAGLPPGHPSMRSFLGVPIPVRDDVFGYLYLADDEFGAFTADDEELVVALASAAGVAIGNAQRYDESRRQQDWLTASIEIAAELLATSGADPIELIARRTHDLAGADAVSLCLRDDDGMLVAHAATGASAASLIGQRFSPAETLGGLAMQLGRPLLRPAGAAERPSVLAQLVETGPVMAVPLQGKRAMRGVLTIARTRERRPFTEADLAMAADFAGHASVALELADARRTEDRLAVFEDRERIARDLHDHVIQELFAIGLSLEGAATALAADDPSRLRMRDRVDDIDRTIRRIRTSIFALRGPLDVTAAGLRRQVIDIAEQLAPVLGFAPHVEFDGPVDASASHGLLDDVTAVVRAVLAVVAARAATTAEITVRATGGALRVSVTDDGGAVTDSDRAVCTGELHARAAARGGTSEMCEDSAGGMTVTWQVPLS